MCIWGERETRIDARKNKLKWGLVGLGLEKGMKASQCQYLHYGD